MVVRMGVDGAGAAFTLYGQGDEPSYGLGTGHHTVCLHLATESPKSPLSGLALTCVCTVYNMYAVIVSFNVKLCSVEHIAKRFGGT